MPIAARIASVVAIAAMTLLLSAAQYASVRCGPWSQQRDALRAAYGERSAWIGVTDDGGVVEIFTSPADTFTVITVRPGDLFTCTIASGYALQKTPNGRNL